MKFSDLNLLSIGNTVQLSAAVYSGEGKSYVLWFPEESPEAIEHITLNVDEWKTLLRQTDLMEVEVLAKAVDGSITKAILRKSQRQIDQHIMWRVFKRDGYRCRYCGNADTPLTVDHLVCWEDGGPSIEENLLSACKKCNKVRGNLPYAEWLRHPRYCEMKSRLDGITQRANEMLVETLDKIPRVIHIKSR